VISLGRTRQPAALQPLLELLADPSHDCRVLSALQELRDPRAIPHLGEALDFEWVSPATVCLVLGSFGEAAVPVLLQALDHECPEARLGAAQRLKWIAPSLRAIDTLAALVSDPNRSIRERAAYTLATIRPSGVAALLRCVQDSDPLPRRAAAAAMADTFRHFQEAHFRALLKDPDPGVRRSAKKALQHFE
jgi:HEAT repeat protein